MRLILFFASICSINLSYSQNLDIDFLRNITINRDRQWENVFIGFTHSAAPVSIALPTSLVFYGFIKKDSVSKMNGIQSSAAMLLSTLLSTSLKYSIDRKRPFVSYPDIERGTEAGSPSFPSGHTTAVFCTATSLSLNYPTWYVIIPSYLWAGSVAYSRMFLGVHYPSDVLGGIVIGVGSAFLCYKLDGWLNDRR
ncbi:MAG: hypothetical protein A3H98_09270 [Bacteroidetes bacterium RIFCSPLOWO2_02_FULL_36_8]|nr:MAG: hypothetical protein A3H98_09270 [Bacteroidetes bacterium RIFCSPLOWO2_02_FULL_36_8]OFY69141.1 MAG: hypothetical protein A3G23_06230 [Bacteroidetes bacterium RIFCSPLOWO2_12_FULL_37_12]